MKKFLLVVLDFLVFSNACQEESCKHPRDPLAEKLIRMDLKIENLENDVKCYNSLPLVAFSAYNPTTTNPGDGQIMIFAEVNMNEGNGYNASNGKFTAPTAGFYQISAHLCAASNKHMAFAIVYNETEVARSTVTSAFNPGCGSVNTLVKMATGEEICVKGTYGGNELLENRYRKASFLGMLFHV